MDFLFSLVAAIFLSLIHLFGYKLRKLNSVPRSIWLSIGGGISVAYVFMHILPELHEGQIIAGEIENDFLSTLEYQLYFIALVGLILFYGLERFVKLQGNNPQDESPDSVFWIHIGTFTIYNLLIGELLSHRLEADTLGLLLFTIAMAAHFLVNDLGMIQHHREKYVKEGRWLLATGVILGWLIGRFYVLSEAVWLCVFAFISGGTIMNILKEELPEERQSRFWAFVIGALGYSFVLFLLD